MEVFSINTKFRIQLKRFQSFLIKNMFFYYLLYFCIFFYTFILIILFYLSFPQFPLSVRGHAQIYIF